MAEELVEEIKDARVSSVHAVDQPATDLDFVMFKSLGALHAAAVGRKQDFQGLGSDAPGTPQRTSGLPDQEACRRRDSEATPTMCEAEAEGTGLAEALRADRSGDDGTVSDPDTAGDFASAKRVLYALRLAGIKGPRVDECVRSILSDPEFGAGDFEDRESRAFAICTAEFGDKREEGPMAAKQDDLLVEETPEAPPEMGAAEAIEVPASPADWSFAQCVTDAQEMGMGDEDAATVCMLVREEFGDPGDESRILVPEGLTPEALITVAGRQAGLVTLEGEGSASEGDGEAEELEAAAAAGALRYNGKRWPERQLDAPRVKNRWLRHMGNALGIFRRRTPEERARQRLEKEVTALKTKVDRQEKSTRDLLRIIERQGNTIAAALGVKLPDLEFESVEEPVADAGVAPGVVPAAATAAEPEKRAGKDAGAAVADPPGAEAEAPDAGEKPLSETERQELERLRAAAAGDVGADPAPSTILRQSGAPESDSTVAPDPSVDIDAGIESQTEVSAAEAVAATGTDGPTLVPAADSPIAKRLSRRKSVAPAPQPAGDGRVFSSVLRGQISAEDRKAVSGY